jgi:hypothetical protein
LVIDQVNYTLSLLSDTDRRALIGDLTEQQKVLDAKKREEYKERKRQANGEATATDNDKSSIAVKSEVIQQYMKKRDDLEFRTLQ